MNHDTHQYKEINYVLNKMAGKLAGEFIKSTNTPDGRNRFKSDDNMIIVLCYFKSGVMLKGPWLIFNFHTITILATSPVLSFDGSLC